MADLKEKKKKSSSLVCGKKKNLPSGGIHVPTLFPLESSTYVIPSPCLLPFVAGPPPPGLEGSRGRFSVLLYKPSQYLNSRIAGSVSFFPFLYNKKTNKRRLAPSAAPPCDCLLFIVGIQVTCSGKTKRKTVGHQKQISARCRCQRLPIF